MINVWLKNDKLLCQVDDINHVPDEHYRDKCLLLQAACKQPDKHTTRPQFIATIPGVGSVLYLPYGLHHHGIEMSYRLYDIPAHKVLDV